MSSMKVFISYSRVDTAFTELLKADLRTAGVSIWIDHETLQPGAPDWQAAIRRGIEAATAVIYIGSPDAARSVNVGSEVLIAQVKQRHIIPLWSRGDNWIDCAPFELMRAHYLDARGTEYAAAVARLHQTLQGMISNPSMPPTIISHPESIAPTSTYTQMQHGGERELPTQVDLLTLFGSTRLNPDSFDIDTIWAQSRARLNASTNVASLSIPIGSTSAIEPLMLDFIKDGPHGLIIGGPGSGKSTLLHSIITALAISYPPDKVNFVLVDGAGSADFDVYAKLPHTVAVMTGHQQPRIKERFFTMLDSELRSRMEVFRQTRSQAPHLFFITDEFAELVSNHNPADLTSEIIKEKMTHILRLGRQLNIHVLLASQRPDRMLYSLNGYVQYRIAFRTSTDEDSMDIIRRRDAARLPIMISGRGYLLHGDNDLQLFQAARVDLPLPDTTPAKWQSMVSPGVPATTSDLIVSRLRAQLPTREGLWPTPLPTPDAENPTPLVLYLHDRLLPVRGSWSVDQEYVRQFAPTGMVAPLGLFDHPETREQNWFKVYLDEKSVPSCGGPMAVLGDRNSGKTTALRTLLLYFVRNMTADQLRLYVLDPTGAFAPFAALPHAYDYLETQTNNVLDGSSAEPYVAFKDRLQRFIALAAGSERPAALFVVDDYDEVGERMQDQLHDLATLVAKSGDKRAFLALSATRLSYRVFPSTLMSLMATKILLAMSSDMMNQFLEKRPPYIPERIPGRGWAKTRVGLDEIQIAAPNYGMTEFERDVTFQALVHQATDTDRQP